jgi:hypothetical protein
VDGKIVPEEWQSKGTSAMMVPCSLDTIFADIEAAVACYMLDHKPLQVLVHYLTALICMRMRGVLDDLRFHVGLDTEEVFRLAQWYVMNGLVGL